MDDVRHAVFLGGREDVRRSRDIVVDEGLFVESADLRVIQDQRVRAGERLLPWTRPREIRLDHRQPRMQLRQDFRVRGVFVDRDKRRESALLQTWD